MSAAAPIAAVVTPKSRRLDRLTWSASGSTTLDLIKSYKCEKPITRLRFRFAALITAGGGGTVADFTAEAGVQTMFNRLEIVGTHKELGEVQLVNMPNSDLVRLWHVVNDILGCEQDFSDPAPTAGNTGNCRREFIVPFDSPWCIFPFASYLDPRDFTSLQVRITYGANADYAATNLSTITAATIDVEVDEIQSGLDAGRAHYVPMFKANQLTIGAVTGTDIVLPGVVAGAFVPIFAASPHDASAAANAQFNIAGLVRRLTVALGDEVIMDKQSWEQLALKTERDFPKSYTTTRWNAPVTYLADRNRDTLGLLDARGRAFAFTPDTSTTPPNGTTAVVAAAGDALYTYLLAWKPNAEMARVRREAGLAA